MSVSAPSQYKQSSSPSIVSLQADRGVKTDIWQIHSSTFIWKLFKNPQQGSTNSHHQNSYFLRRFGFCFNVWAQYLNEMSDLILNKNMNLCNTFHEVSSNQNLENGSWCFLKSAELVSFRPYVMATIWSLRIQSRIKKEFVQFDLHCFSFQRRWGSADQLSVFGSTKPIKTNVSEGKVLSPC